MTDHNLFYYPYASFSNVQLPLLKVRALYFDKLVLLDPVGASWTTIGADHRAQLWQLKNERVMSNKGRTTFMKLELFTDLIAALGKTAGGLKAIVNLLKAKQENYD